MMGGGFGGCTINLVREEGTAALVEQLTSEYREVMGLELSAYIGQIESGPKK